MPILNSILESIGRTPVMSLAVISGSLPAAVAGKLEMLNPGGSVKDRIGLAMVESARAEGKLRPGDTIVEATAGNTGVALAMAAAVYKMHCVLSCRRR